MSEAVNWSLPGNWLEEDRNERQVAHDIRAEAELFRAAYYEARDEGADPAVVHALHLSMHDAIGQAAQIERKLRLIG